MFEILIAVSFLSLCAYTILETVLTADTQSDYAMRRSLVVDALQDQIESIRGQASAGTLTATTSSTSLSLPGFVGPVTVTTTSVLETNSRTLFDVTTTAAWSEQTSLRSFTDSATISTVVRQ